MCDVWESACSFARSNHTGDDAVQPPLSPETITQTDLVGDRLASKCGCGWYSSLELWLPSERKTLHGNPRCNTAGQLVSKIWFMDTWTERLTGSSSDRILGGSVGQLGFHSLLLCPKGHHLRHDGVGRSEKREGLSLRVALLPDAC
jgi:hypothetical protein